MERSNARRVQLDLFYDYRLNVSLYPKWQAFVRDRHRFASIAGALEALPDETMVDGEIIAYGDDVRPSFNVLQNHRAAPGQSSTSTPSTCCRASRMGKVPGSAP
jgi:hypothetical protein